MCDGTLHDVCSHRTANGSLGRKENGPIGEPGGKSVIPHPWIHSMASLDMNPRSHKENEYDTGAIGFPEASVRKHTGSCQWKGEQHALGEKPQPT